MGRCIHKYMDEQTYKEIISYQEKRIGELNIEVGKLRDTIMELQNKLERCLQEKCNRYLQENDFLKNQIEIQNRQIDILLQNIMH